MFYINPLREEVVHINPRVILYHEVMTNAEIAKVKESATPKVSLSMNECVIEWVSEWVNWLICKLESERMSEWLNSFIPDISIASLQVNYYSEELSAIAWMLCQS